MITKKWIMLVSVIEFCGTSGLVMGQGADVPKDVLDKLQQQPPAQMREMTVVPNSQNSPNPGANAGASADVDKLRSVRDLLEQVENNKGAETGTIKAIGAGGGISL